MFSDPSGLKREAPSDAYLFTPGGYTPYDRNTPHWTEEFLGGIYGASAEAAWDAHIKESSGGGQRSPKRNAIGRFFYRLFGGDTNNYRYYWREVGGGSGDDCPACDNQNVLIDFVISVGESEGIITANNDLKGLYAGTEWETRVQPDVLSGPKTKITGSSLKYDDGFLNQVQEFMTGSAGTNNEYVFKQKYSITDVNGKVHQFTARGRIFLPENNDLYITSVKVPITGSVFSGNVNHKILFYGGGGHMVAELIFSSANQMWNFWNAFFTRTKKKKRNEIIRNSKKK